MLRTIATLPRPQHEARFVEYGQFFFAKIDVHLAYVVFLLYLPSWGHSRCSGKIAEGSTIARIGSGAAPLWVFVFHGDVTLVYYLFIAESVCPCKMKLPIRWVFDREGGSDTPIDVGRFRSDLLETSRCPSRSPSFQAKSFSTAVRVNLLIVYFVHCERDRFYTLGEYACGVKGEQANGERCKLVCRFVTLCLVSKSRDAPLYFHCCLIPSILLTSDDI